ncbi:MAG TPA: FAD-linked oxidase C-terminal domain-containing protein [Candidatus Baltobacteraceae bacterium]|nr:FAD-linked oxidase C-terminal domain-containing protein [Candidatus Baltobacteraceae bacterium]
MPAFTSNARDDLAAKLRAIVPGDRAVLTSEEDLIAYGYDAAWFDERALAVVRPETAEQVAQIHRLAVREHIPITPRAMGSSLSGGAMPSAGAIVLSVMRMNRILEIDTLNRVAVVQAGVITADLQQAVEAKGLFYPPDPSSLRQSAIGGNIAENAGGARCLKYGVTGDYVTALQVVLPDGTIVRTGGKTVKNVTGYDLRSLFTGAEGTLGTITEATLRLLPKPKYERTALAAFRSIDDAASCIAAIMSSGLTPTAMELLDSLTVQCVNELGSVVFPPDADAVLIFAVDGAYEEAVRGDLEQIAGIVRTHGAIRVDIARSEQEREAIWNARRSVSPALARRRPNKLGEDVCVPVSEIPAMIGRVREIAGKYDLAIPVFGHAGDGNLHPNILCDRRDREEIERVREAAREIFEAAVSLGGTLSGEHGIGVLKKQFMELDLGADAIALMRRIKDAIDPEGIMNPGKVFPDPGGSGEFRLGAE